MTAPWCMALIDLPVPTTTSRDTSKRTASRPMRSCSVIASSPSSAISPSTAQLRRRSGRARPAAAGDPGQCLQAGPHRVGVGVVGVVDHRHAVGAGGHLHPVPRHRAGAGQRGGHLLDARRRIPARRPPRTARCSPGGRRARRARRRRRQRPACSVNVGRASSSSVTGPAQTSAPARPADPYHPGRRSRSAIAATAGSSTLSTTTPDAGTACGSSALVSRDGFARAELAQMRGADVEDHPDRGRRDRRQRGDIAGMARRHLQDQVVGAARSHATPSTG